MFPDTNIPFLFHNRSAEPSTSDLARRSCSLPAGRRLPSNKANGTPPERKTPAYGSAAPLAHQREKKSPNLHVADEDRRCRRDGARHRNLLLGVQVEEVVPDISPPPPEFAAGRRTGQDRLRDSPAGFRGRARKSFDIVTGS